MSLLPQATVTLDEAEVELVNEYLALRRANDPQHFDKTPKAIILATPFMNGISDGIRLYGRKSKEVA